MMTAMTWSGAPPILAYQSYIYESGGFELTPNISIIITGTANIISGIACMLTIKWLGKRRILLIAGGVMTISLLALSMFFSALENGANISAFRWVPSLFVMLFTAAYGFGINPLTFAYISEVFVYEMKVPAGLLTAIYYSLSCVGAVAFYQVNWNVSFVWNKWKIKTIWDKTTRAKQQSPQICSNIFSNKKDHKSCGNKVSI